MLMKFEYVDAAGAVTSRGLLVIQVRRKSADRCDPGVTLWCHCHTLCRRSVAVAHRRHLRLRLVLQLVLETVALDVDACTTPTNVVRWPTAVVTCAVGRVHATANECVSNVQSAQMLQPSAALATCVVWCLVCTVIRPRWPTDISLDTRYLCTVCLLSALNL